MAEAKVFANVDGSAIVQLSLEVPKTVDLVSGGTSVPQNSTFGGCVEVGTGISVNVGADGSLLGLFEDSITEELFAQNFTLFQVSSPVPTRGVSREIDVYCVSSCQQKCFGDPAKRDPSFVSSGPGTSLVKRADFACPEVIDNALSPIVSEVLMAVAKSR